MRLMTQIHNFIFNFYAFIILSVDKRDDELTLLLDNEENSHYSVITQE